MSVAAVLPRLARPATLATAIVATFPSGATPETLVAALAAPGAKEVRTTLTATPSATICTALLAVAIGDAGTIRPAQVGTKGRTDHIPRPLPAVVILSNNTGLAAATTAARLFAGGATDGHSIHAGHPVTVEPLCATSAGAPAAIAATDLACAVHDATLALIRTNRTNAHAFAAVSPTPVVTTLLVGTIGEADVAAGHGMLAIRVCRPCGLAVVVAVLVAPPAGQELAAVLLLEFIILAPLYGLTVATPLPTDSLAALLPANIGASRTEIGTAIAHLGALVVAETIEGRLAAA